MTRISIKQRLGDDQPKPIERDFPEPARIALAHLIEDLRQQGCFNNSDGRDVMNEALRCGRFVPSDFILDARMPFVEMILAPLKKMAWDQVYTFCEKVFQIRIGEIRHFQGEYDDEGHVVRTQQEMQNYYSAELNLLLAEENIAYRFVAGEFQRQGRAQTQKNFQRVGTVLGQPRLAEVRKHFGNAQKFFNRLPEPDAPNCIKEALCSLEAALEILSEKPASKGFVKVVRQLQGDKERQIPGPIAEGMIKLYAYRGDGQGVAHASLDGSRVTPLDAELVLSVVASYITYLVDLLPEQDDIPF